MPSAVNNTSQAAARERNIHYMNQVKNMDELALMQKEFEAAKNERESEEENVMKLEESATKRMIRNGKIHAMVQQEIENAIRFEGEKADEVREEAEKEESKQ